MIYSRRLLYSSFNFTRYSSNHYRPAIKDFNRKTFDYFYTRRLKVFNNNREQMLNHIRSQLESILKTSSVVNYLTRINTNEQLHQTISIQQFNDILFFAYEHNIKLDKLISRLIESTSLKTNHLHGDTCTELINLLVLHQQKHYDIETKRPNEILQHFTNYLEFNLTKDEIKTMTVVSLSLLCSAMYRLQIPFTNVNLLEHITQYLIDDETKRSLSAVDKQNLIKMLTLSNYGKIPLAQALANRFNQSFEENMQSNLNLFSYEIVRMTMRIGIYFSMLRFYSSRFFKNCLALIQFEANSSMPVYRAKDIIQITNTLIYMGYLRQSNSKYLDLIDAYHRMNQFNNKPDRLLDVLAPLAMVNHFPEKLLEELFTKDNLHRITESRMKEKLFFISESYKLLSTPSREFLDQNYIQMLPHHLFGSWEVEKRKRPYFSIVVQRLLECVPNRNYVKTAFLLKHFKSPDIIICLNAHQRPQIIPHSTMKRNIGLSGAFDSESSLYALQVLSKDDVCINEPLRPLGMFYTKAYQLKKLKYIPVIIYPNDDLHQVKTAEEIFQWIVQRAQTTGLLLTGNEA